MRLPIWIACVLIAMPLPTLALDVDLYAELLDRHTKAVTDIAGTRVDYAALKRDPAWAKLVASLAASRPEGLRGDAKLAFWLNAYNILAIDLVAKNHPIASIRDIGSFLRPVWKRSAGSIGGRDYTLHEIEHEIVRKLGDPRAHAGLVCASLSCPPLRREPYRAADLGAQLDDNTRRWLADPRKGARADGDTLRISQIFKWFDTDFEASGGVPAFVARYGLPEASALARRGEAATIRYLDYDWSLNDLAR